MGCRGISPGRTCSALAPGHVTPRIRDAIFHRLGVLSSLCSRQYTPVSGVHSDLHNRCALRIWRFAEEALAYFHVRFPCDGICTPTNTPNQKYLEVEGLDILEISEKSSRRKADKTGLDPFG